MVWAEDGSGCRSSRADLSQRNVPRLCTVAAAEICWQGEALKGPQLRFCKAAELTPERFWEGWRGDLSLSQTEELEALSAGATSDGVGEEKEMKCYWELHWSQNNGRETNLAVAENSNQVLSTSIKKNTALQVIAADHWS